jgi:hypothetical protein
MKFSPLEKELDFCVIEVVNLFDTSSGLSTYEVVKILGESDVIARIGGKSDPEYQHRRFGRCDNLPTSEPKWFPVSNFSRDLKQVIADAHFEADEIDKRILILPAKAHFRIVKIG